MNQHAAAGAILGLALSTPLAHAQLPCPPEQMQRVISACGNGHQFGTALSVRDDRLAIGRFDAPGGRISTYILDPIAGNWVFDADLRPNDLVPGDVFGATMELFADPNVGDWRLAGASPQRSSLATWAGKVYVFERDGNGQWVQQSEVLPDQSVVDGRFGDGLAWTTSNGRTFLVVGAPTAQGQELIGSTYVFEEDGQGGWIQQAHLQAPDGSPDDAFGFALASAESASATVLVVGSPGRQYVRDIQPGSVYFYRFDAGTATWILEDQFEAPDPYDQDLFGFDVAVAPVYDLPGFTHRALVGCVNEGGFGWPSGHGGAYLYLRAADGTWALESHLTPPVANPNDMFFGRAVDLMRDGSPRLLIGAPENREFGLASGVAYVFERDDISGEWLPAQALYGQEADALDVFGVALGLGSGASAGLAVIGAHTTQCVGGNQTDAVGAVYSFDLNPGEGNECPPPVIHLQKVPDCSSGPGGELEVRWFQATPDRSARIAILYARQTGNFAIPNGNPCAGLPLGLGSQGLQVAHIGSAGPFGAGRLRTNIPRAACGGYLQLLDINRCKLSNVVRIE